MTLVKASVIVATLNEVANIDHVMDTALNDEAVIELIIADGGSDDATVDKIRSRAATDARVRLVPNPDRHQAAGLNRAASLATGTLLVRLDGHTRYADDYVTASLRASRPGVAVGGPMMAAGSTAWAKATATAMLDPLAIGPARFHHASDVEYVDTVYLGTFERDRFLEVGGYRTFPSGTVEDTDFYTRWRNQGGTVVVDPTIRSWYRPRDTWRALARQYFRYGSGKAELVWLNGRLPSLRPLAPALLVAGLVSFTIIGITSTWLLFAVLGGLWITVLAIVAARAASHRLRTAIVTATMHVTYGAGLWRGMFSGRPAVQTLGLGSRPGTAEDPTKTD
ncbi:MAG: glycosyltransferase family 2 protein [Acidimicrobiia bacterium]|nr:MAG: glycosyltransferase family 2 protein [Acidimicrobiia bacterium]